MDAVQCEQVEPLDVLVRRFRRRTGLTQRQAAERAGISTGSLRDVEQGRVAQPRAETLQALAGALELSDAESDLLLRSTRSSRGVRVQILGPLMVLTDGVRVDLGSATQRTLLGVLALSPNTVVSRDALIDVIWGETPPPTAGDLLQTHLSRLRRRLRSRHDGADSPQLAMAAPGGYRLAVSDDQLDLLVFRNRVAAARQSHEDGDLVTSGERYGEAVGLWRSRPLAGLTELEAHPAVAGVTREWQTAVVEYATVASDLGRHDLVVDHLQRLVEDDPLHEAAHARLMIALAGTGQQAAALTVFDEIRHRLADELGIDPGRELSEAHQQVLRQEITRPEAAPVSARRQLPPDIADFTGRQAELAELREQMEAADQKTAITISAIDGMAGVGKTRLALHLAHQLVAAGRFADIQLYVDLRGHSDEPPIEPAAVLASFLHLLGVPGDQIPKDLEERAALYRDRLHDKHAVVVLDNAASEDQVRPLLPASPTNLVVVTSRRILALDGAGALSLDIFSAEEAHTLLVQVVGERRTAAEPDAAVRIVDLCGRLPLAVSLAARRLQARPAWTLADLSTRLQVAGDRLEELAAGNRQVRAVFDLSYHALEPDTQRLFRLLALHPGEDFTAYSAAALTDDPIALVRKRLDQLVDEHLVTMVSADRYRLHDLLHDYAAELTQAEDSEATRRAAIERVLDYYLHTAERANRRLGQRWAPVDMMGTPPTDMPVFSTSDDSQQWLRAELPTLSAAIGLAADLRWSGYAWRLACELGPISGHRGRFDDWEKTLRRALDVTAGKEQAGEAALLVCLGVATSEQRRCKTALEYLHRALEMHRQSENRPYEIYALNGIAIANFWLGRFTEALRYSQTALSLVAGQDEYQEAYVRSNMGETLLIYGRFEEALEHFQSALALARQLSLRNRESGVLAHLGDTYRRLGRYDEAMSHLEQALQVARNSGSRPKEGYARYCLGLAHREHGQLDQALAELSEALEIVRAVGGEATESEVLIAIGAVHRDAGDLDTAHDCLRQAHTLAVETRDRYQEARALDGLAHLHHRAGRADLADQHWQQAKALFTELGTAEADQIPAQRLADSNDT